MLTLSELVRVLIRRRRLVVFSAVAFAALLIVPALLGPRTYSSRAMMLSDSPSALGGGVGALAARLGVGTPLIGSERSLPFFLALSRSDAALKAVVTREYSLPDSGERRVNLLDLYGVREATPELRIERGVRVIREKVRVSADLEANALRYETTSPSAALSRLMLETLLAAVDSLNLESRKRQASSERKYLEERTETVAAEVAELEARVSVFASRNRRVDDSPELRTELARLERAAASKQSVLVSLLQSLEQARAAEMRSAPSLVPVEAPTEPAMGDRRYLILRGLVGILFGVSVGLLLALAQQSLFGNEPVVPAVRRFIEAAQSDLT